MQSIEIEELSATIGCKQTYNINIGDVRISRKPIVIRVNFKTCEVYVVSHCMVFSISHLNSSPVQFILFLKRIKNSLGSRQLGSTTTSPMKLESLTYHAVCENTDDLEAADELGRLQNPPVKPDHLYTLYPGQSGMANRDNLGRGGYADQWLLQRRLSTCSWQQT